jgi:hypothetical protein
MSTKSTDKNAAAAEAAPITLAEMIEANQDALEVLRASSKRLRELRNAEIDPDERARITAERQDILNEINLVETMVAHLMAAQTVIQPMSPEDTKSLRELAQKLDKAIMQDAIVNATLGFIQDLFDATEEIRKLSRRHS